MTDNAKKLLLEILDKTLIQKSEKNLLKDKLITEDDSKKSSRRNQKNY